MNISNHRKLSFVGLVTLVGLAALPAGCSSAGRDMVGSRLEIVGQATSAATVVAPQSVQGTYTTCVGRHDGDTWTMTTDKEIVNVAKDDVNCRLAITGITLAGGAYLAGSPLPLDQADAYEAGPQTFTLSGEHFHANAKISSLLYAADFTVTVLLSNDAVPDPKDGPGYTAETGSFGTAGVPAPNDTLTFGGFGMWLDGADVVESLSGHIDLNVLAEAAVPGQDYKIITGQPAHTGEAAPTQTQLDAFWGNENLHTASGSPLTSLELSADWFGLMPLVEEVPTGVDLSDSKTEVRTVIVRNTVSGVSSYEYFIITFKKVAL